MNGTTLTFDQVVSISKVRSDLSGLIGRLKKKQLVLVSQKYRPAAALVSIPYLEKLLAVYSAWQRDQDFRRLEALRDRLPTRSSGQVARDVEDAVASVRQSS